MRVMKDSGIEWIGEIPQDWEVKPIRANFEEVCELNILGQVANALKFTYGEIVCKQDFDVEDDYVAKTIRNYTVVNPGTIMLNGLNLNFDFVSQRIGLVKDRGAITSAYIAFRPKDSKVMFSKYANYLFKSYDICKAFHNMGSGVRKILNFEELKKVYIPIPPVPTQQAIADYLDTKCEKIDALVVEKEKQVEKLQEYKKALIFECVTGKREVA